MENLFINFEPFLTNLSDLEKGSHHQIAIELNLMFFNREILGNKRPNKTIFFFTCIDF